MTISTAAAGVVAAVETQTATSTLITDPSIWLLIIPFTVGCVIFGINSISDVKRREVAWDARVFYVLMAGGLGASIILIATGVQDIFYTVAVVTGSVSVGIVLLFFKKTGSVASGDILVIGTVLLCITPVLGNYPIGIFVLVCGMFLSIASYFLYNMALNLTWYAYGNKLEWPRGTPGWKRAVGVLIIHHKRSWEKFTVSAIDTKSGKVSFILNVSRRVKFAVADTIDKPVRSTQQHQQHQQHNHLVSTSIPLLPFMCVPYVLIGIFLLMAHMEGSIILTEMVRQEMAGFFKVNGVLEN